MGFCKDNYKKFDNMTLEQRNKWYTFSDNITWGAPVSVLFLFAKDGWIVSIVLVVYLAYGIYMQLCANSYRSCLRRGFENLSEEDQEKFIL